jgi:tRNA U34 2-thiouridine synthase MnmA/TrmU
MTDSNGNNNSKTRIRSRTKTRTRTKAPHALGLLSGGLDSMLAIKLLQKEEVEVTAITFRTPFFSSERGETAARILNIPHMVLDITRDHLEMVKAPKYGYGRNMNPCIDCHAMMFSKAGDLMEKLGAHFLFSGEVLGQRPMSQNHKALRSVEKTSGYGGFILRPLSAKLLPETEPEIKGLVDRSHLLDIQGRSRTRQIELAEKWGITEFPTPGGGCLLTDPGFSVRLRELFTLQPDSGSLEVERLKVGRHFRLPGGSKAIVGRDHQDNERLQELFRKGDLLLKNQLVTGPLTLLDAGATAMDRKLAAALTVRYGKGSQSDSPLPVRIDGPGEEREILEILPLAREDLEKYRVG